MVKVVAIELKYAPSGQPWHPYGGDHGFWVVDRTKSSDDAVIEAAIQVTSLEEAAEALSLGFSIWMMEPGHGPVLVRPDHVRVVYE